jgi:NADH dehydrogenase
VFNCVHTLSPQKSAAPGETFVDTELRSLDEPRTFGRAFDVGGDEAFTTDEMVDVAARVLGRRPPWKLHLLPWLLAPFAGLFERLAGLPRGAFADLLLGVDADLVGDVGPIRAIIPLTPMRYAQAVERALAD